MSKGSCVYKRRHCGQKLLFALLILIPIALIFIAHSLALAWTATGDLCSNRFMHTATLLSDGKVFVAGGMWEPQWDYDLTGYLATCELYDPSTGTWTTTGSLAVPREVHTVTLLPNGKVLLAGGYNWRDLFLSNCELYDPSTGALTDTGIMGQARGVHTATLLPSGKVLVAGGIEWHNDVGTYHSGCELYDPSTEAWTTTGSLDVPRYYHTATLLPSGKVLVVGGNDAGGILSSCELYDPSTGAWTTTGSLQAARGFHTATLLPNGKVLVFGGRDDNSVGVPSSELYDPATGTWATTGSLLMWRSWYASAVLPSGRVLVTGGFNGAPSSSCELYNPSTGIWTAVESLVIKRNAHTATLLQDGNVLVAGGSDYYNGLVSSCELYDPSDSIPGAPTMVTANAGNTQAIVSFKVPESDGGNPITSYTVTSNPGNIKNSGPASPITLKGLTNGTAYTFTVTASNKAGKGPPSSPSDLVIPQFAVPAHILLLLYD